MVNHIVYPTVSMLMTPEKTYTSLVTAMVRSVDFV